jgi:RimJ/RimL family protein N-acetyltransferase
MDLTLRPPRPVDYSTLASWVPDAQACLVWAGPLIPFPISVELLDQQLAVASGRSYFLTDANDGPVGFGQHWVLKPGSVHLGRIIVAPTHRGKGVGRSLCTQLVLHAKAFSGASTVTLRVFRANLPAHRMYESLGFSAIEEASDDELLFMATHAG